MSDPTPSPTRLTPETPLSSTFPPDTPLSCTFHPDTPSTSTFPPIPARNPSRNNNNNNDDESHRPSQNEVTLIEALRQGPIAVPKNPRRLSEFEANLSRRERRKSKAWAGQSYGIAGGYGEGEGGRRKSGPLDAEELKVLVFGKLRRITRLWSGRS